MSLSVHALSDELLKNRLERLIRHERRISAVVIEHVAEVERRALHLTWGFSSLFDYLTKGLGYSESAAYRRQQAARALRQVPEIQAALENGSLNLSQVAQTQSILRQEEKVTGTRLTPDDKRELFAEIANKTTTETKKILNQRLPDGAAADKTRPISTERHKRDASVELTVTLPPELYAQLKRVKELYSHIEPNADWLTLLRLMATDVLQKRDTLMKKNRSSNEATREEKSQSTSASQTRDSNKVTQSLSEGKFPKEPGGDSKQVVVQTAKRKTIPAGVRRAVFLRDNGCCQYPRAGGGICGNSFQIELDHITPVFAGGTNEVDNLRLYCRAHNSHRYKQGARIRRT